MLGKTQNTEIGLYFSLLRWLLNAFCSSLGSLSFPNNISFSQIKDHSQGVKATFAIPFFNLVRMKNPKLITIEKKLSIYEILLLLLWTLCFTWTLWGKKKKLWKWLFSILQNIRNTNSVQDKVHRPWKRKI